ncbi:MAG: hypothetical protein RI957_506 [Verrucomicrobiota bacterium]|jgi:hypothetical protein
MIKTKSSVPAADALMKPAILAARGCIQQLGIQPDRCEVLQDAHTIVVRLTDTLVARIVTDTEGPRQGTTWFSRETALAAHLTRHQAPVIPLHPDIPPIAHMHDGFAMNFWHFVTATDASPSPRDIGASMHHCHQVLQTLDEPLPTLAILHESLTILQQQTVQDSLPQDSIDLLARHLHASIEMLTSCPQQALHGDAHMGNLLMTTQGLLWTDWEDAFAGPVEWDLASVIWNAKLLENDHATVNAIVQAYESCGTVIDHQTLDQCLIARAAVMSAWYPILYPNPSPERLQKLRQRLAWLRSMP